MIIKLNHNISDAMPYLCSFFAGTVIAKILQKFVQVNAKSYSYLCVCTSFEGKNTSKFLI